MNQDQTSSASPNGFPLWRAGRDLLETRLTRRWDRNSQPPGNLELDSEVAAFLLEPVQTRLPNWGYTDPDGTVVMGRVVRALTPAKVRPMPLLLFTVNWADSGPGFSWPETYYVTYVPQLNVRIVTASRDSEDVWGCTDLAIGWCKPRGRADWGTKKIITLWWHRGCGVMMPWESFWAAGLVTQARAERWRGEVFGVCKDLESF